MVTYKSIYRYHVYHYKAWLCKNHQWMLNLGGTFQEKQDICVVLKGFSTECLSVARGEIVTRYCGNQATLKPGDHN